MAGSSKTVIGDSFDIRQRCPISESITNLPGAWKFAARLRKWEVTSGLEA